VQDARSVPGTQEELHRLIMRVRSHLMEPAYRLPPDEITRIEQRIAELGGRHGWLRWKRTTKASQP
jgi:hypothetical protein